ncbi:MAG TPA: hypothetical protein VLX92_20335 [Kofleriaceae bacterium]|nr:hypothetical protein [Kofleriaceae bacterium]
MTRAWRELRPFVLPACVLAVYAIVRVVYLASCADDGVLTPSGGLDRAAALLGVAALALRIVSLTVVPALVVYRLVMRVHARRASRP